MMLVTVWILLIAFGLIGVKQLYYYIFGSINVASAVLMGVSIIITALSAGVIWGGLFSGSF